MEKNLKAAVLAVATALLFTAAAYGSGEIVSSFRSPCGGIYGLDYYGKYLYHCTCDASPRCFWITTTTGSVVGSIANSYYTAGSDLDYTGVDIWTCRRTTGYIYRLTTTGSFLSSFYLRGMTYNYGIAKIGAYLYFSNSVSGVGHVYRITTSGNILGSFKAPGSMAGGLDPDGDTLWVGDGASPTYTIYRVTTAGSIVESIPQPGHRPEGVAWDGSYLWYTDYGNNYVYRITTEKTAASPASLGRVKAIWR